MKHFLFVILFFSVTCCFASLADNNYPHWNDPYWTQSEKEDVQKIEAQTKQEEKHSTLSHEDWNAIEGFICRSHNLI